MNTLTSILPYDAVMIHERTATTTSLKVAEIFGKNHRDVLRDIRALNEYKSVSMESGDERKSAPISSGDGLKSEPVPQPERGLKSEPTMVDESKTGPISAFTTLNFKPGFYEDAYGRAKPLVEMTKNGFTLLAMGYTGEKAMLFKIAYIQAFDEMATRLERGDVERGRKAEAAYFKRWPEHFTIRRLALEGEPYWYIGQQVSRTAATVGRAVRKMVAWGLIEARRLASARQGMASWWAYRRKHHRQIGFDFGGGH